MRLSPWRCIAALPRSSSSHLLRAQLRSRLSTPAAASLTASSSSCRTYRGTRHFSGGRTLREEEVKLTRFAELADQGLVHPNLIRSITDSMKLETMTEVQSTTIRSALKGTDVVAQAKTGTGKTLAFLIPLLHRMVSDDPDLARSTFRPQRTTVDDIRGIIISPTRELAEQIAEEARRVVKGTAIIVQTAVGGTQKGMMLRQMQREGCHLLVGTPGRLTDLFSDGSTGVAAPGIKALVLDEADRLLDQGFWPDIQNFMSMLPPEEESPRQTLMFSATIPREVVGIVRQTLKPGFQFARVIGDADVPTTDRVKQKLVITQSYENQIPALLELMLREINAHKADPINKRPFKAIIYFRSTLEVTLYNSIFRGLSADGTSSRDAFGPSRSANTRNPLYPVRIYDIHGKLTQGARTAAADGFKRAESAILFSSDVTARGMDFPEVTHVIQVGPPADRESYIHRIGRTARAGKEGEGWIIVTEPEVDGVDRLLSRIPIEEDTALKYAQDEISPDADPTSPPGMVREAAKRAPMGDKAGVYTLYLGKSSSVGKRKHVAMVNNMATIGWGMSEPPAITPGMAGKMGLNGLPGITVSDRAMQRDDDNNNGGGRFGRRDGGGGGRFGNSGGSGGGRFGNSGGSGGGRFGNSGGSGGGRFGNGGGGGGRFGGGGGGGRRGGEDDDPFADTGSGRFGRRR